MKWMTLLIIAAAALLMPASAEVVTNQMVPWTNQIFVPCIGETVALSGATHLVATVTLDGKGGTHLQNHTQVVGASGVGLISGDTYRATATDHYSENTHAPLPYTSSYIATFRFIGQGPAVDFLLHQTIHVTINADGTTTADVSNTHGSCK